MNNSVKLYSNGSAVITRVFRFVDSAPLHVSIPVKTADMDEVVSSLAVFGNVDVTEPPTYAPTNSASTTLTLDGTDVLRSLATTLRGAAVEADLPSGQTVSGRLFGVQVYQQETAGTVSKRFRIVVGTSDGIRQLEESAIAALRFKDDWVQVEVDKALQASLASIRPDSRSVSLTLASKNGPTEAAVSYATPCAAWKIRYQLRVSGVDAALDGQAVVDNDTDDDWRDVSLSVITGEPISFATDIADIRRPRRSRVNVVKDVAPGAVDAEDVVQVTDLWQSRVRGRSVRGANQLQSDPALAFAKYAEADSDEEPAALMPPPPMQLGSLLASRVAAQSRESGDFSVFTSAGTVTVPSRTSAIINLFTVALEEVATVLLYKPEQNAKRPYRAIKLRNTTPNSLGRGVCEVYVDGERQGKCVLDYTQRGQEVLLVHAVETGVLVLKEQRDVETRRTYLRIGTGVAEWEQVSTAETSYRIDNRKAEPFHLEIEHSRTWPGATITATTDEGAVAVLETSTGWRLSVELSSNSPRAVEVREEVIEGRRIDVSPEWLEQNVIAVAHPLGRSRSIRRVLELQAALEEVKSRITAARREAHTLSAEQERLIKLLPSVHSDQANQFRTDIAETETNLREIRRVKLPALRLELHTAKEALRTSLANLSAQSADAKDRAGEA